MNIPLDNTAQLRAGYAGNKRRPFQQFAALQSATNDLKNFTADQSQQVLETVRELLQGPEVTAGSALLAYRLLRSAADTEFPELVECYGNYLERLRSARFWLESAFSEPGYFHQSENTFFAPYPFHFPSAEERREISNLRSVPDRETSYRRLLGTLRRTHDHPSLVYETNEGVPQLVAPPLTRREKGLKSAYNDLLFKSSGKALFDAIAELHFEASENASSHALPTDLNPHVTASDATDFFGDAQYFQTGHVSYRAATFGNASEIHPSFQSYLANKFEESGVGQLRTLYFCYVDNGPGIVPHMNKYGSEVGGTVNTLCAVISEHLTSRSTPGAGYGLQTMQDAILDAGGCLIIQSAGEFYSFDGIENTSAAGDADTNRGTIIFAAVPLTR